MNALSPIDWIILSSTLLFIVVYGLRKKAAKDIDAYLLGSKEAKWWTIGLSVMATQASAITFLSTPGQAYADGMRFVQFYFGLPIAMVILCITFIPIYYRLKVYTAYEYLESRFDLKTRSLAAILFLVQRGLAAGITIYAPAIILSSILGWNLDITIITIGALVIIYTVTGGTKAVSQTQKLQMVVILIGMAVAFYMLLGYLPEETSFSEALHLAGASGKMQVIDFSIDLNSRYTFWSGITGGVFLALSYFGTDQSQVQRYLSGRSIRESRLGLMFNALLKVPMQFGILLTGVMVFVFYQTHQAPLHFNKVEEDRVLQTTQAEAYQALQAEYAVWFEDKQRLGARYLEMRQSDPQAALLIANEIAEADVREQSLRQSAKDLIKQTNPDAETNDKDYVFITWILNHMPKGLVGLLLAMIFSAAMSSTAAELNALGSTTTVDIYRRNFRPTAPDRHFVRASMGFTLLWGIIAILFALFGTLFENLIQFVNIIGSIFYGTILGIFLAAFYVKRLKSQAVFLAALVSQSIVLLCYFTSDIGYLWFNVIGCGGVILIALFFYYVLGLRK